MSDQSRYDSEDVTWTEVKITDAAGVVIYESPKWWWWHRLFWRFGWVPHSKPILIWLGDTDAAIGGSDEK